MLDGSGSLSMDETEQERATRERLDAAATRW
jgi:hypothetical protein